MFTDIFHIVKLLLSY